MKSEVERSRLVEGCPTGGPADVSTESHLQLEQIQKMAPRLWRVVADEERSARVDHKEVDREAARLEALICRIASGTKNAPDQSAIEREIVLQLGLRGFQGHEWELFRTRLAKYAWTVIRVWCLNGKMLQQFARIGFGGLVPPPREIKSDDAAELAMETVAEALYYFRDRVLIRSKWDPEKGASLATFFVGACIRCFGNVYDRWRRENTPFGLGGSVVRLEAVGARHSQPLARLHAERALHRMSTQDQEIVARVALGESQDVIARDLGMKTSREVGRHLERIRSDALAVFEEVTDVAHV